MNLDTWLASGLILGLLAACWSYVKMMLWRILSLFIVHVRVEDDTGKALAYLCWQKFKRSPFGERRYQSMNEFVQPVKRCQTVGFETIGQDPTVFWYGWFPLVVYWNAPSNTQQMHPMTMVIVTLRGLFDIDKLLIEAIDAYNKRKHEGSENGQCRHFTTKKFGDGRRSRASYRGDQGGVAPAKSLDNAVSDASSTLDRRILKWKLDELGYGKFNGDAFIGLAFPPEVMELVLTADRWLRSEKWYAEKNIPWRLGYLLYGAPGTGKTSLVKALGRKLDLPVIAFDLTSYDNEGFHRAWTEVLSCAPCIILLEDIDAAFKGRENRLGENGGGLTFDCLLNCISGVQEANGILLIVTTNNIDDLDDAIGKPAADGSTLSTRPGRIDRALELKGMTEECRRELAERILCDCPEQIEVQVAEGYGDTGAQFQERCAKVALIHYWENDSGRLEDAQRTGRGRLDEDCGQGGGRLPTVVEARSRRAS